MANPERNLGESRDRVSEYIIFISTGLLTAGGYLLWNQEYKHHPDYSYNMNLLQEYLFHIAVLTEEQSASSKVAVALVAIGLPTFVWSGQKIGKKLSEEIIDPD